jgi:hypothetical protein
MSNTTLHTHAPMGNVTRIGWNGWPYGPANAALTGFLARSAPALMLPPGHVFDNDRWLIIRLRGDAIAVIRFR